MLARLTHRLNQKGRSSGWPVQVLAQKGFSDSYQQTGCKPLSRVTQAITSRMSSTRTLTNGPFAHQRAGGKQMTLGGGAGMPQRSNFNRCSSILRACHHPENNATILRIIVDVVMLVFDLAQF